MTLVASLTATVPRTRGEGNPTGQWGPTSLLAWLGILRVFSILGAVDVSPSLLPNTAHTQGRI